MMDDKKGTQDTITQIIISTAAIVCLALTDFGIGSTFSCNVFSIVKKF